MIYWAVEEEQKPEFIKLIEELAKLRKIPQYVFIDDVDSDQVIKVREDVQKHKSENPSVEEIDLILQSPGGDAADAYRILRTFRKNYSKVNIIIPFWAKSAATLIALGATDLIMNEFGELGPIDTQLVSNNEDRPESALIDETSLHRVEIRAEEMYRRMLLTLSRNRGIKREQTSQQLFDYIAKFYNPLLSKLDTYEIGKKRRYLEIAEKYAGRILQLYSNTDRNSARFFIDYLVNECPDHGYIIDYDLVSLFMKNAKKSNEISEDYDKVLTKLSILFLKNKVAFNYTGFIVINSKKRKINKWKKD